VWDLNAAERRALAASLAIVGLAGVVRLARAPARDALDWRDADPGAAAESPRDSVSIALAREARAQTPLAEGERIDVSSAPPEELRRIPGIGPGLAAAIVRERASRPFREAAELERVPGIGPATLERLAPHVTVGSGAAQAAGVGISGGEPTSGCRPGLIDVNRADPEALVDLPGVGPVIAGRIVEARERSGPFPSIEALAGVSGVGPRSLERIAPFACAG
jgi:competence ComEA-like helix-hairpin-helix protein